MAKYKNFPDPVIQHIYSLADRVNEDAMELEEMKLIDPKSFGKVATSITNAFLKETTFWSFIF